jgi:hypothetical protein
MTRPSAEKIAFVIEGAGGLSVDPMTEMTDLSFLNLTLYSLLDGPDAETLTMISPRICVLDLFIEALKVGGEIEVKKT